MTFLFVGMLFIMINVTEPSISVNPFMGRLSSLTRNVKKYCPHDSTKYFNCLRWLFMRRYPLDWNVFSFLMSVTSDFNELFWRFYRWRIGPASTRISKFGFLTDFVPESFGKYVSAINTLCRYNFETNQYIFSKPHRNIVGCSSQRYNNSVKQLIQTKSETVKMVRVIMGKLRNLTSSVKLRYHTTLHAKCYVPTRWSLIFQILSRCQIIPPFLCFL